MAFLYQIRPDVPKMRCLRHLAPPCPPAPVAQISGFQRWKVQKSLGSSPGLKVFVSGSGQFDVARMPVMGQIKTVTVLPSVRSTPRLGGLVWFVLVPTSSCQVSSTGLGDGVGNSSGAGMSLSVSNCLLGTVPLMNSSVRRNSSGTFVAKISLVAGTGSTAQSGSST